MEKANMSLCVIPARSGSKRIPGKNIRMFHGKPIIAYPIQAALESGCFNRVIVSTDSEKIAEIAVKYGAEVPFFRSSETSNDTAGLAEVALEVLGEYKKVDTEFSKVCCILPTAAFITSDDLRIGGMLLERRKCNSVISIVPFPYPIERAMRLVGENVYMIHPENYTKRTQDCEQAYHDAGQFYWVRTGALEEERKLFIRDTVGMAYEESELQDIDTEQDWQMAEMKYARIRQA
jgi:N-acylneuraminate cytidylyltransferase